MPVVAGDRERPGSSREETAARAAVSAAVRSSGSLSSPARGADEKRVRPWRGPLPRLALRRPHRPPAAGRRSARTPPGAPPCPGKEREIPRSDARGRIWPGCDLPADGDAGLFLFPEQRCRRDVFVPADRDQDRVSGNESKPPDTGADPRGFRIPRDPRGRGNGRTGHPLRTPSPEPSRRPGPPRCRQAGRRGTAGSNLDR